MERRILSLASQPPRVETRVGTDPPAPVIVGYAALFHDPGDKGTEYQLWEGATERVLPGCFDRACREDDVRALFNHSPDFVLGRLSAGTLKLSVDQKGLRYAIRPPDTQVARDLMENIRAGNITGSSFSFGVRSQKWTKNADGSMIRELHDVSLMDVGPVSFPAYEASTTGLRASGGEEEARAAVEAYLAGERQRVQQAQADARARCVRLGL